MKCIYSPHFLQILENRGLPVFFIFWDSNWAEIEQFLNTTVCEVCYLKAAWRFNCVNRCNLFLLNPFSQCTPKLYALSREQQPCACHCVAFAVFPSRLCSRRWSKRDTQKLFNTMTVTLTLVGIYASQGYGDHSQISDYELGWAWASWV